LLTPQDVRLIVIYVASTDKSVGFDTGLLGDHAASK